MATGNGDEALSSIIQDRRLGVASWKRGGLG